MGGAVGWGFAGGVGWGGWGGCGSDGRALAVEIVEAHFAWARLDPPWARFCPRLEKVFGRVAELAIAVIAPREDAACGTHSKRVIDSSRHRTPEGEGRGG